MKEQKMKIWQDKLDELEQFKNMGQIDYGQYQKQKRKIMSEKPLSSSTKKIWSVIGLVVVVLILIGATAPSTDNQRKAEVASQQIKDELDETEANRAPAIDKFAPLYCSSHQSVRVTGMPDGMPINDGRGWTQDECRTIIDKLYSENPAEDRLQAIVDKKVWVGMTKLQFIYSWGDPEDINTTVVGSSRQEQWVYGYNYVYFKDNIVTSYQV